MFSQIGIRDVELATKLFQRYFESRFNLFGFPGKKSGSQYDVERKRRFDQKASLLQSHQFRSRLHDRVQLGRIEAKRLQSALNVTLDRIMRWSLDPFELEHLFINTSEFVNLNASGKRKRVLEALVLEDELSNFNPSHNLPNSRLVWRPCVSWWPIYFDSE